MDKDNFLNTIGLSEEEQKEVLENDLPQTVFGAPKSRELGKGYVMIFNDTLQNKELSFVATGLLAYMLSLPKRWVFRKKQLYQVKTKEGRTAVDKAFNELIKAGHIIKVPHITRSGKGQFKTANIQYAVYEISIYDPVFNKVYGNDLEKLKINK